MAPQQIAMRSLLSYQRAHEEQADRAGVKFLTATGQSAKGMYETFKRFSEQIMFTRAYMPTRTCSPIRCRANASRRSPKSPLNSPNWEKKDPPELQLRHDMMRAKLRAFLDRPDTVQRAYPPSNTSLPARYARAIATYRHGEISSAVTQIDALIQSSSRATPISTNSRARRCWRPAGPAKRSRRCARRFRARPTRP